MYRNEQNSPSRVLVVDDDPNILRLVEMRLRSDGFETLAVDSGENVLNHVRDYRPDVILLDVDMPGMDGFQVCELLKSDPQTMLVPVIFLTAKQTTANKVRGLELGAVDYISKPFDVVELQARVRSAARTKYLLDLLEQKAQIDGLTGLYSRGHFDKRIVEEIERGRRYCQPVSLIIVDVDHFKKINDEHGHFFGDRVLVKVAGVLREGARTSDLVARYGGEEFVLVLPNEELSEAAIVAERIRQNLESLQLMKGDVHVRVTASFGCACTANLPEATKESLVVAADKALYSAKEAGRNRVHCWDRFAAFPVHTQFSNT